MDTIIEKIECVLEWLQATLKRLKKWWIRKQEEKRRKEIEKIVVKLWRLSAVHRINVDDLSYVETQCKRKGREYIWEVGYNHKYIFGRED